MAIYSKDLPEALKRIAAELAAQTGKLDLSGLQIIELPPEMQDLASLKKLDCSQTQVSDLGPLRGLASLQNLNCGSTKVSSLEPLRGLPTGPISSHPDGIPAGSLHPISVSRPSMS